jgi:hypothetical protein
LSDPPLEKIGYSAQINLIMNIKDKLNIFDIYIFEDKQIDQTSIIPI